MCFLRNNGLQWDQIKRMRNYIHDILTFLQHDSFYSISVIVTQSIFTLLLLLIMHLHFDKIWIFVKIRKRSWMTVGDLRRWMLRHIHLEWRQPWITSCYVIKSWRPWAFNLSSYEASIHYFITFFADELCGIL